MHALLAAWLNQKQPSTHVVSYSQQQLIDNCGSGYTCTLCPQLHVHNSQQSDSLLLLELEVPGQ